MWFHLVRTSVVLFLISVPSLAVEDPKVYFNSHLPNTPIPESIKDSLTTKNPYVQELPNPKWYVYRDVESDEEVKALNMSSPLFLEKDIYLGTTLKIHLSKDTTQPTFLPRQIADLMPFTSDKLDEIYKAFSINTSSIEAKLIEKTISLCETASNQGENLYAQSQSCATSLESMVDYVTSNFGTRVKAISSQVNGNEGTTLQEYQVKGVKKLASNNAIVCHHQYYAYAVHYCHKSGNINMYNISLDGENNLRANTIIICHQLGPWRVTTWVRGKHLAFQEVKGLPDTTFVCHFVDEDEVAWVPY